MFITTQWVVNKVEKRQKKKKTKIIFYYVLKCFEKYFGNHFF